MVYLVSVKDSAFMQPCNSIVIFYHLLIILIISIKLCQSSALSEQYLSENYDVKA